MKKKNMRFLAGILSVIMALTPLQGVKASETDSDGNTVQQSLKLNEVNSSPDDWVEIINTGAEELDISGYELRDNSDDHRWKFADNTTVSANGLLLVDAKTVGLIYDDTTSVYGEGKFGDAFGLGSGDSIRLYDAQETLLDEYAWTKHPSYMGNEADASYGRCPDGTGEFVLTKETPGSSNEACPPEIVINEVESNGDSNDWVEIYNAGDVPVDISGWYLLDNDPEKHVSSVTPLEEGTVLQPGDFYVFEEKIQFDFGLGKADSAVIYNKYGVKIAEYTWQAHAAGVYARIPDGTGEFADVATATKGKSNSDYSQNVTDGIEWPGAKEVTVFDTQATFLEDSSGLDYYNGQLYAVDNGTGKFWILDVEKDGSMKFAKGFENGKRVRFQKDAQNPAAAGPDAEGISVDENGYVYLACERDNSEKGVNYDTILQVNPNAEGTDLVALKEWDITDSLPPVSANMGIEAVEWVSGSEVNGVLFNNSLQKTFQLSDYPNAVADGVFFVALEENGHVYAYVLNEDGSSVQVADIDAKIGGAMALDYDTYEHVLWVVADNGYNNLAAKIKLNGTQEPEIVHVLPPEGLDVTANNEGFAIAGAEYTVNGQRPVYRFTDGVTVGSLKIGSLSCDYVAGSDDEKDEDKPAADSGNENKPGTGNNQQTENKPEAGNGSQTGSDNGSQTGTDNGNVTGNGAEKKTPAVGTVLKDEKTKAQYKVIKAGATDGKVAYVKSTNKKATTVTIPSVITVDGVKYRVTSIAKNAFKNNKTIKKVTIGNNVTTIESYAFSGCTKLSSVTLGKNVKTIKAKAFYNCKKLKNIQINSAKLTSKTVDKNALKGILKNAVVKVPQNKVKAYKKFFYQKGLNKKTKITKK